MREPDQRPRPLRLDIVARMARDALRAGWFERILLVPAVAVWLVRSWVRPDAIEAELLRYLVRLITPSSGTVLDPFMGSGSTGLACIAEGFSFIGIDQDEHNVAIARTRLIADSPLFAAAGGLL